jgi:hypothetical protein
MPAATTFTIASAGAGLGPHSTTNQRAEHHAALASASAKDTNRQQRQ